MTLEDISCWTLCDTLTQLSYLRVSSSFVHQETTYTAVHYRNPTLLQTLIKQEKLALLKVLVLQGMCFNRALWSLTTCFCLWAIRRWFLYQPFMMLSSLDLKGLKITDGLPTTFLILSTALCFFYSPQNRNAFSGCRSHYAGTQLSPQDRRPGVRIC